MDGSQAWYVVSCSYPVQGRESPDECVGFYPTPAEAREMVDGLGPCTLDGPDHVAYVAVPLDVDGQKPLAGMTAAELAVLLPRLSNLQLAAMAMTAMHQPGRQNLRTKAHLAAWVAARQHGVDVDACDAIADAALAGMYERLAEWASEKQDEEGGGDE